MILQGQDPQEGYAEAEEDPVSQEILVILSGDACEDEAEDAKEGACDQERGWAPNVKKEADRAALRERVRGVEQGWDDIP